MKLSRKGVVLVMLALPLALAGCAEEEPEVAEVGGIGDAGTAAEPAVMQPAPATGGGMEQQVVMNPLNNSGLSGQATVAPEGTQARVMVTLNSATGGSTHQGHIHQGRCDSPGSVVQPLQPVTLDQSGTGTMTTTVPVEPNTVLDGQHIIVYHAANGDPGAPAVCGDIPMHQM